MVEKVWHDADNLDRFRVSPNHPAQLSRNWETISFMSRNNLDLTLGITAIPLYPALYTAQKTIDPVITDTLSLRGNDSTKVK
jgi:hypothetical protein